VTSVTRDDLPDGGAEHFYRTIRAVREQNPGVAVEALLPDFGGDLRALERVLAAWPEVAGHNLESVPSLYGKVRPQADYGRSLAVLQAIKTLSARTLCKTGLMVGLGEREDEVIAVMKDARDRGCEILTIGQYLAPSRAHYPVAEYVHPDTFDRYRRIAQDMGFRSVASGPLVRSSFLAHRAYRELAEKPA
jgi:lipoic acid synthetase